MNGLIFSWLEYSMKIVTSSYDTFENKFEIEHKFSTYFEEGYKYFWKDAFVREIS